MVLGRRRAWVVSALLLAIVIRGLIPVGFMPGVHGLEICPGGMDPVMARLVHAHHHSDPLSGAPRPAADHGVSCAFASSAGGFAPVSAIPRIHVATLIAEYVRGPTLLARSIPAILRAQAARAPPSLS